VVISTLQYTSTSPDPTHDLRAGLRSCLSRVRRVARVADVIECEVDEDGSYRWTMWEWTGAQGGG
jgi:hypothetical protein